MNAFPSIVWKPLSFLLESPTEPFGLIILNAPIKIRNDILADLWNKATIRVTVDGGTDKWLEWLKKSKVSVINDGLPNLVTGDFDSIHPHTLSMLREKSVQIIEMFDQDQTDFTKAVKCLNETTKVHSIVVLSEVYGRLDQIMSQLNTLFLCDTPIVLLSSCCASWLLRSGEHKILIENLLRNPLLSEDRWVGLIPVGAPATVTTSGLKWNLGNTQMKFGGVVSTSNTYNDEPIVKVSTDQPLVWSMGISLSN